MIIILESLYNLKKDIEEFEIGNTILKVRFKDKSEDVNYLIEVIEQGT